MSSEVKICANCGLEIEDEWLKVGDNYLQVKYFDSDEDNCFCSRDCLCEALSVLTVDKNGNTDPY